MTARPWFFHFLSGAPEETEKTRANNICPYGKGRRRLGETLFHFDFTVLLLIFPNGFLHHVFNFFFRRTPIMGSNHL